MLMRVAAKIPTDYYRVAIFLGMECADIENIQHTRDADYHAFRVLQAVVRANDAGDMWERLQKALDEANRRDVVNFMNEGDTQISLYLLYTHANAMMFSVVHNCNFRPGARMVFMDFL